MERKKVGPLRAFIRQGHAEGQIFVIDEYHLEPVPMTLKEFKLWQDRMYSGRHFQAIRVTQNAIDAYSRGVTLDAYLQSIKGGDGGEAALDNTQADTMGDGPGPAV